MHIELKREGVNTDALSRLYPYLKKGEYKAIEFKTRDGQQITYSESQLIKLVK